MKYLPLIISSLYFLRQGSSLNWKLTKLTDLAKLVGQQSPSIILFLLPQFQGYRHVVVIRFYVGLGI